MVLTGEVLRYRAPAVRAWRVLRVAMKIAMPARFVWLWRYGESPATSAIRYGRAGAAISALRHSTFACERSFSLRVLRRYRKAAVWRQAVRSAHARLQCRHPPVPRRTVPAAPMP